MTYKRRTLDDHEAEHGMVRTSRAAEPSRARQADRDTCISRGQEAWERHRNDCTWTDWLAVFEALEIGRTEAMAEAGTNRPEGSGYNRAFGKWLARHGFADIDKDDRSRGFEVPRRNRSVARVAAAGPAPPPQSPVVLRKWKAATKPKPEKPATVGKQAKPKPVAGQPLALEAARSAYLAALQAEAMTQAWVVAEINSLTASLGKFVNDLPPGDLPKKKARKPRRLPKNMREIDLY